MEIDKTSRYQIPRNELSDRLAAPILQWVKLVRQNPDATDATLHHFYEDTAPTEFAETFKEWFERCQEIKKIVGENKQLLRAARKLYVNSELDYLIWTGQTK